MRKLWSILVFALLMISYQFTESNFNRDMDDHKDKNSYYHTNDDTDGKAEIEASAVGDRLPGHDAVSLDNQNDLVYRDYATGIRLSESATLIIPQLDLMLDNETADIYAIDLEHQEISKVCSYQPLRDVSYSPSEEGVYIIIAKISDGETVDLTPDAMIETSAVGECADGFLFLK